MASMRILGRVASALTLHFPINNIKYIKLDILKYFQP